MFLKNVIIPFDLLMNNSRVWNLIIWIIIALHVSQCKCLKIVTPEKSNLNLNHSSTSTNSPDIKNAAPGGILPPDTNN
jgi:hypothetical protein